MADPKEEQIEKKIEETGKSKKGGRELTDADVEKLAGGVGAAATLMGCCVSSSDK